MFRMLFAEGEWRDGEREDIGARLASMGLSIVDGASHAPDALPVDVVVCRWLSTSNSPAYRGPGLRLLACDRGAIPAVLPAGCAGVFPIGASDAELAGLLADLGYAPFSAADADGLWPMLDSLTGGDADVRAELVQSLADTNAEDLARLAEACHVRNWEEARAMAHRIKGTARMLNCHAMVAVSQSMENAAAHADGASTVALLRLLTAAVHRLLAVLSTQPA